MADQRLRRPSVRLAIPVAALMLASCGGSDDPVVEESAAEAEAAAAVTTTVAPAPTTTEAPATTEAPSTTVAEVNYAAAVVVVANASSVNGSAGRMSDILSAAGYTMGSATNSTEGQLGATKVYYATGDEAAQAVAESIVRVLGGAIELLQLPGVPPVESASLDGATVLIALGDDWADRNPTAATGG
jgi:PBP1b-binding outer membrane lipoprotein LpoB